MGKVKQVLFIAGVAIVANALFNRFAPAAVKNAINGTTAA